MLVLAAVRIICIRQTAPADAALPDSRRMPEYDLAYINTANLGLYSSEAWRNDGLMGVCLNLMRNGYLTLMLPELTADRLFRADLLVSVAPAREYTAAEQLAIWEFVHSGGVFITTVGYDEREPSRALLARFGFAVGDGHPGPTGAGTGPLPLGFFKSPYLNAGDYMAFVRFHAAWPLSYTFPDTRVLAYGAGDVPVAAMRRVGDGKVVVVSDTCFPMNKNLEKESGAPFEGMRENPHFWRWLLNDLREQPAWIPPDSKAGLEPRQQETEVKP
jgi:hypothetical protein